MSPSWADETRGIRARLEASRSHTPRDPFEPSELEGVPPPVRRYLRNALVPGQAVVSAVTMRHTGTFNTNPSGESWRRFASAQRVVTRRPGFDWDARISMLPGVSMRVHDAFVNGEGILHAALFGLLDVANQHDTTGLALGELMRFLAEAAWYPTALLPREGVRWLSVDDRSANARLTDGTLSVMLLFRFTESNVIESVRADARSRTAKGVTGSAPWEGRWSEWERRDGMLIPTAGEVAWLLPEGRLPYWRGRLTDIQYEFAPQTEHRLVG